MNGNFKRGDVVVQIGGSSAYVVSRRHGIWYEVKYLWCDGVCRGEVHYFSLDSVYVKVDFCKNASDDNAVHDKLMHIAMAFRED
jgi:hypothetical protein